MNRLSLESAGYRELLYKLAEYLRMSLGMDQIALKDPSQNQKFTAADEVALNTGKPYVENGLSDYSAFPELIEYYNHGFKSCAIIPVASEGKAFGTITLLSKDENGFSQEHAANLSITAWLAGMEAGAKYEKEKSINLAKYFDASFNNMFPQLLVDGTGNVIKANKSALNYFNRSQKELPNTRLGEIFDIDEKMLSKLRGGAIIETTSRLYAGKEFNISPSRISDSMMHLLINEVSEIKEAEEKIKFLDNSVSEAFAVLDGNMEILWASGSFDTMFGSPSSMIMGRKFTDFVLSPANLKDALKGLQAKKSIGDIRLSFGNEQDFRVKLVAFPSGREICCVISRDYDKYVGSFQKVATEIVALSNDPMLEIDGSGYLTKYNKAAESLFALDKEVIGTPIYSICADSESQNKIVASLGIAKNNGYLSDVYVNLIERKNRSEIPCVQTIKALPDEKGNVSRFIIMNKELASKRKFNELLDELEKEQREAEKLKLESDLKSQFIYNISHDLKTPITNIMGFSKLLLTDGADALTKEQKEYIQIIYDESERFLQLVKQILDVAKLSSGIVKLDVQDVNFNDIGENPSIKALREACENKGLYFNWIVDADVPLIGADPNRLIQVFSNLLSNAIKFTNHGGVTVHVMRNKKKGVRVDVSDTGIGISKEDRPKIFKKFYQIKRDLIMQQGSGTGLGLSIVKEVVNLHGGQIKVESEPGEGTTFWFTMPLRPDLKKKTIKYNAEHQAT